jgi:hypothetical protein
MSVQYDLNDTGELVFMALDSVHTAVNYILPLALGVNITMKRIIYIILIM